MQKALIFFALVVIFGCASADLVFNQTAWAIKPTQLFKDSTNDDKFRTSLDVLIGVQDKIVALASASNVSRTHVARNISTVKTLTADPSKDTNVTVTGTKLINDNGVSSVLSIIDAKNCSQVLLINNNLNGGASSNVTLTNNTNNATVYTTNQTFFHRSRNYVVYGVVNTTNLNVVSAKYDGSDVQTAIISKNASNDANGAVSCAGISGVDEAYCVYVWKNVVINATNGSNISVVTYSLVSARVALLNFNGTVPDDYDVHTTGLPSVQAYNAGKQYGLIIKNGLVWTVRNNNGQDYIVNVSNATGNSQTVTLIQAVPYFDSLAVFFTYANSTGNANALGYQNINNGTAVNTTVIINNGTNVKLAQNPSGALYVYTSNIENTIGYIGQVWGSTGLSGSVLKVTFAAIFAVAAVLLF